MTTYHGIGNSISHRAGLLAEFERNREAQKQLDEVLGFTLLEKAPTSLREWLNEDMILTNLFRWGRCDTKIYFEGPYGFKGIADVRKKMQELRDAWKDVVLIKMMTSEDHRVEVVITAIL